MTHIFIEDLYGPGDVDITLETKADFDSLPRVIRSEELEKAEGGCIAVGKTVFIYGWGDDCPAHIDGVHYGKGRCRKCGQPENPPGWRVVEA